MRLPRCVSLLAAMFAVALLSSCITAPEVALDRAKKTTLAADHVLLPTTEDGGYLLIDVKINSAGPFRMLLDTGAESSVVSARLATAVGMAPLPRYELTVSNAAGGKVSSLVGVAGRLECGGFVAEDLPMVIMADTELAAFLAIAKVDGIIGISAFKDAVLELDFPGRQVTVARQGLLTLPPGSGVPYTRNTPHVQLDVAGRLKEVVIDSGKSGLISLGSFEGVPLLTGVEKNQGAGAVFGASTGARSVFSQLAGEARLGPLTWLNPPIETGSEPRGHGLIGVEALRKSKVVIDPLAKQVYFLGEDLRQTWEKLEASDPRFTLGYHGQFEGAALRLLEVDPNGAADLAGLRAGDLLLTIDGAPAIESHLGENRTRVRVRRGDREFETRLILAPDYAPRQVEFTEDRNPLPTSTQRGGLIIEAFLNGSGPYRFLVSTRSRALSISPAVIDVVGLKPLANWQPDDQNIHAFWVESFKTGGLTLRRMAAVASPATLLASASATFGPLDGVIGIEALLDVTLELDFPRKAVNAVRPGIGAYPADRGVLNSFGAPMLEVDLAGKSLRMLVDSTSPGMFELPSLEEYSLLHPAIKADTIVTGSGTRTERAQLAGEARGGPVTWVRPPLLRGAEARIGLTSLSQWRLVIDPATHRLYFLDGALQRVASEPPATAPGFRPGYFARREGAELKVLEVDAGEAFDRAGVRVGDAILSIDGVSIPDYMKEANPFAVRRGAQPVLRLRRDGREFETRLVIAPPAAP